MSNSLSTKEREEKRGRKRKRRVRKSSGRMARSLLPLLLLAAVCPCVLFTSPHLFSSNHVAPFVRRCDECVEVSTDGSPSSAAEVALTGWSRLRRILPLPIEAVHEPITRVASPNVQPTSKTHATQQQNGETHDEEARCDAMCPAAGRVPVLDCRTTTCSC